MKLQYPLHYYIYGSVRRIFIMREKDVYLGPHFNVMIKDIPRINIINFNVKKPIKNVFLNKKRIPIIKINNKRYLDFTKNE